MKTIALILAGLLLLAVIVIFPGLNFREWLKEKFKEANGEPITELNPLTKLKLEDWEEVDPR